LINAEAACRESRRPVAVLSPHRASLTHSHGGTCPDLGGGARGNGNGGVRH
ncbi:Protein crumbs 1, partial [Clarias magur]